VPRTVDLTRPAADSLLDAGLILPVIGGLDEMDYGLYRLPAVGGL
jgi:hypothetical protein